MSWCLYTKSWMSDLVSPSLALHQRWTKLVIFPCAAVSSISTLILGGDRAQNFIKWMQEHFGDKRYKFLCKWQSFDDETLKLDNNSGPPQSSRNRPLLPGILPSSIFWAPHHFSEIVRHIFVHIMVLLTTMSPVCSFQQRLINMFWCKMLSYILCKFFSFLFIALSYGFYIVIVYLKLCCFNLHWYILSPFTLKASISSDFDVQWRIQVNLEVDGTPKNLWPAGTPSGTLLRPHGIHHPYQPVRNILAPIWFLEA